MNRRIPFLLSLGFLLLLAGAVAGMCRVRWLLGPGGDGTIGTLVTADQCEFKVVQKYNGNPAEPYSVHLYHRTAGGTWRAQQIDFESSRWSKATLIWHATAKRLDVFKGKELRARYTLEQLNERETAVPTSE